LPLKVDLNLNKIPFDVNLPLVLEYIIRLYDWNTSLAGRSTTWFTGKMKDNDGNPDSKSSRQ